MENLIINKDSRILKILNDLNLNIENKKIEIESKSFSNQVFKQNEEVIYYNELHLILRFIRNQEPNTIET
jgi:hypothetical protein